MQQPVDEQWHRTSGAALVGASQVCAAGDVEVRPAHSVRELPQEAGRGDGAGFAAGDIRHVGEIAFQEVGVFLGDRHAPGAVVGALARGGERRGELVVRREQAAVVRAERDHAGARERRDVDDGAWLEAARIGDAVAKDQTALGVGVQDLDGLAGHRGHDVARLGRAPAWHVLAGRDDADDVQRRADGRDRLERAEHGGRA